MNSSFYKSLTGIGQLFNSLCPNNREKLVKYMGLDFLFCHNLVDLPFIDNTIKSIGGKYPTPQSQYRWAKDLVFVVSNDGIRFQSKPFSISKSELKSYVNAYLSSIKDREFGTIIFDTDNMDGNNTIYSGLTLVFYRPKISEDRLKEIFDALEKHIDACK